MKPADPGMHAMHRARPDVSSGLPLVAFRLGSRYYALPLEVVSEIVRMVAVRPVPDTPPWLLGVIDLRGTIVSVVDPKVWLGLPHQPLGLDQRIVVVRFDQRPLGVVADVVIGVVILPQHEIQVPDDGAAPALSGVARHADDLIFILDTEWVSDHLSGTRAEHVG